MKVVSKYFSVIIIFASLISFSCISTIYKEVYPALADGRYDSEFPYRKCSDQLEKISECVKMLNSVAHYRTYIIAPDKKLTRNDLKDPDIEKFIVKTGFYENTAAGTATIFYCENQRIALLTCAHVVKFDDTVFVYRHEKDGSPSPYLESVAVKDKQNNYIADLPDINEFEILQMNTSVDVALLGQEIKDERQMAIPKLEYPFGKAKDLEWGSFVYIFGYPMGYKTLTKALVSSPNKDKYGSFIVDAVFNRGSSGGIILAVKDGVPNFELVGMIKFVPAESEYVIKPFTSQENESFNPFVAYDGPLYVEKRLNMRYGVSKAVSIECIKNFIAENLETFKQKGYDFSRLIGE